MILDFWGSFLEKQILESDCEGLPTGDRYAAISGTSVHLAFVLNRPETNV